MSQLVIKDSQLYSKLIVHTKRRDNISLITSMHAGSQMIHLHTSCLVTNGNTEQVSYSLCYCISYQRIRVCSDRIRILSSVQRFHYVNHILMVLHRSDNGDGPLVTILMVVNKLEAVYSRVTLTNQSSSFNNQ